jgi:hypothetical protein
VSHSSEVIYAEPNCADCGEKITACTCEHCDTCGDVLDEEGECRCDEYEFGTGF